MARGHRANHLHLVDGVRCSEYCFKDRACFRGRENLALHRQFGISKISICGESEYSSQKMENDVQFQENLVEKNFEHSALLSFLSLDCNKNSDQSAHHPSSCESENWIQMRDPKDEFLEEAKSASSACQIVCIHRPNNETKNCDLNIAAETQQSVCESDESQWISIANKAEKGEGLEVSIIGQPKTDECDFLFPGIVSVPTQEPDVAKSDGKCDGIGHEFEVQRQEDNFQSEEQGNQRSLKNSDDSNATNFFFEDGNVASATEINAEGRNAEEHVCFQSLDHSEVSSYYKDEVHVNLVNQSETDGSIQTGQLQPTIEEVFQIKENDDQAPKKDSSIAVSVSEEQVCMRQAQNQQEPVMNQNKLLSIQELLVGKVKLSNLTVAELDAVALSLGQRPLNYKHSKPVRLDHVSKLLGELGGNAVSSVPVVAPQASTIVIPSALELVHCKYGPKSIAKALVDRMVQCPTQIDDFCTRFEIMNMLALTLGSFEKPSMLSRNLNELSVDPSENCANLHKKMDDFASLIDKAMAPMHEGSFLEAAADGPKRKQKIELPQEPTIELQHTSKKPRKERIDKGMSRNKEQNGGVPVNIAASGSVPGKFSWLDMMAK